MIFRIIILCAASTILIFIIAVQYACLATIIPRRALVFHYDLHAKMAVPVRRDSTKPDAIERRRVNGRGVVEKVD